MLVGHSHGGNIIIEALRQLGPDASHIDAAICVATPFTYLEAAHQRWTHLYAFATSNLFALVAYLAILRNAYEWHVSHPFLLVLVVLVVGFIGAALVGLAVVATRPVVCQQRPLSVPLFLMRSTRDEASLVLGLVQASHYVTGKILAILEQEGKWNLKSFFLSFAVTLLLLPATFGCMYVVSRWTPILVESEVRGTIATSLVLTFLLFSTAVGTTMFLAANAVAAVSVGFWQLWLWPSTVVEVDVAPADVECSLVVFSRAEPIELDGLRHGLYDEPRVQQAIGTLLRSIYDERRPDGP